LQATSVPAYVQDLPAENIAQSAAAAKSRSPGIKKHLFKQGKIFTYLVSKIGSKPPHMTSISMTVFQVNLG